MGKLTQQFIKAREIYVITNSIFKYLTKLPLSNSNLFQIDSTGSLINYFGNLSLSIIKIKNFSFINLFTNAITAIAIIKFLVMVVKEFDQFQNFNG